MNHFDYTAPGGVFNNHFTGISELDQVLAHRCLGDEKLDVAMDHVLAVKEDPQLTDFVIKISPFVFVVEC